MSAARTVVARTVAAVALGAALPLLVQAELVAWLGAHGAVTLMLGAASGASRTGVVVMALALALRVYTMVLLPGLAVAWLVTRPGSAPEPREAASDELTE